MWDISSHVKDLLHINTLLCVHHSCDHSATEVSAQSRRQEQPAPNKTRSICTASFTLSRLCRIKKVRGQRNALELCFTLAVFVAKASCIPDIWSPRRPSNTHASLALFTRFSLKGKGRVSVFNPSQRVPSENTHVICFRPLDNQPTNKCIQQ